MRATDTILTLKVCCLTDIWLDEALVRARELDAIFEATGKTVGPYHGLPISLKVRVSLVFFLSSKINDLFKQNIGYVKRRRKNYLPFSLIPTSICCTLFYECTFSSDLTRCRCYILLSYYFTTNYNDVSLIPTFSRLVLIFFFFAEQARM